MKRIISLLITLVFLSCIIIAPAYSGGGKVQGELGSGSVDQGGTGSVSGNAAGADAQGNQV